MCVPDKPGNRINMGALTRLSLSFAFLWTLASGSAFSFSVIHANSQTTLIMIYLVSFLFSHGSIIMCMHTDTQTHKVFLIIIYFIKISHVIHHPCTLLDLLTVLPEALPAGQHSLIQSSGWLPCPISGMGHNWFNHSPIPRNTFYTTICTETNMKTDNEKHNMFWWFYFPLESFWEGIAGWKSIFFLRVCFVS